MIIGHGGNIYEMAHKLKCAVTDIIDMSSNVNPLGPPPGLIDDLKQNLDRIVSLPEVDARGIIRAFAAAGNLSPDRILAGNGSTQFIYTIPKALETRKALIVGPTYADYADACRMHQVKFDYFMTTAVHSFQPDAQRLTESAQSADTVFICNPNNPTGVLLEPDVLLQICRRCPQTRFIIDESYLPFAAQGETKGMAGYDLPNVIVLNSMSKMFRIPGLRIGFLIAPDKMIERFRKYMLPWSVNAMAQTAVQYLMSHASETHAFIQKTRGFIETEKAFVLRELADVRMLRIVPSTTCFFLVELCQGLTAGTVYGFMAQEKILIRNCENFEGLSDRFVRFSLKSQTENEKLVKRFKQLGS